ncbi:MAG: trimeric intracellular cation channel family protein [Ruminococcaceae bacterium]|nr:trimeric intracellular cation channel family protein [Oscillospiraceae bacterium]
MAIWVNVFDMIGTVAFAVSGALTGIRKHMDIFGISILALSTATFGGIIRDVILGITPPTTFQKPAAAMVAITTAIIVFLPPIRKRILHSSHVYDLVMLVMDSLGLGAFTVIGVQKAYTCMPTPGLYLCVSMGVLTGVGGGVLRDVMAGITPDVFVKRIYASACIAGALLCCFLWGRIPSLWAMLCGTVLIVAIRFLAAHYRWSLPRA